MDVAAGGGNGDGFHAAYSLVDGPGVIAPGHHGLSLDRDALFFADLMAEPVQVPGINGAPVHKADHSAAPQLADGFGLGNPGQVGGSGGFQHNGHVGLYGEYRALGPPAAHFLLDAEGEPAVIWQLRTNEVDHHGAAEPVVNSLAL